MSDAKLDPAVEYAKFYSKLLGHFCVHNPDLWTTITAANNRNPTNPYIWTKNLVNLVPFGQFHRKGNFTGDHLKPQHSYIGLIAMAILSTPEKRMILSDIYNYISEHYPYFRNRGGGWRNSIRHNLSLNPCFVKSSRSANGKGHYWAIHPANLQDFKRGDFCRRKAQRKASKEPCFRSESPNSTASVSPSNIKTTNNNSPSPSPSSSSRQLVSSKRTFDMESLLAPEAKRSPT